MSYLLNLSFVTIGVKDEAQAKPLSSCSMSCVAQSLMQNIINLRLRHVLLPLKPCNINGYIIHILVLISMASI